MMSKDGTKYCSKCEKINHNFQPYLKLQEANNAA